MLTYTRQTQVRRAFWQDHPQFRRRPGLTQNDYPAEVRTAFVGYVDSLQRSGMISERLAEKVTL